MTTAAAGDLRALTQAIYQQYSFQRLRPCETTVSSGLKGAESCKDERFSNLRYCYIDGGRHVHKSPPCAQEKSVQMAIKKSAQYRKETLKPKWYFTPLPHSHDACP